MHDVLGHYEIREKLGSGGMGDVYLAEDVKLRREVALKVLPDAMSADPQRRSRFLQEAHAASVLNHPNVSTIYEIGEAGDTVYIAMEYIQGKTLAQILKHAPVDSETIIDIATQVADALDEAELRGIVHRDIKSANIMVTSRGHVKVLDFGLAKLMQEKEDEDTRIKTSPGMIVGTSYYMSPEQALGRDVDHRSDLFSLGIVLYELTTGTLPFVGSTTTETIQKITNEQPAAIARFNYSTPPELERIIRKLLEKEPARRYQSARELLVDLRNLKRDTSSGEVASPASVATRRSLVPWFAGAASILLIASLIFILWSKWKTGGAAGDSPILESVAVMPFVNVGNDPEMEYLSDGISETLINELSGIPSLRVIPRSTAFRYKGSESDLQAIARELDVQGIVSGRVSQRGDLLSIQAELIDVKNNSQMWGARYERQANDFLSIQEAITRELTSRFLPSAAPRQEAMTSNSEAYQLYLKGRYHWNKRTAESMERALAYFQEATAKDPSFALAHVGVADSYLLMEQYADKQMPDVLGPAEAAVRRALAIDDRLAEAHTTLAFIHEARWEWEESEREFKRAIELDPNYATARHWYNIMLRAHGRLDEAMVQVRKAQELDPVSMIIGVNVVDVLMISGRNDEALEVARAYMEIDSEFPQLLGLLGLLYSDKDRHAEAITTIRKAAALSGDTTEQLANLGIVLARAGERDEAEAILRRLEAREQDGRADPYYLASLYTALGSRDLAFDALYRSVDLRSGGVISFAEDPRLKDLRADPRTADLKKRIGLRS